MENQEEPFAGKFNDGLEDWAQLESKNASSKLDLMASAPCHESSATVKACAFGLAVYVTLTVILIAACWFGSFRLSSETIVRQPVIAPKYVATTKW